MPKSRYRRRRRNFTESAAFGYSLGGGGISRKTTRKARSDKGKKRGKKRAVKRTRTRTKTKMVKKTHRKGATKMAKKRGRKSAKRVAAGKKAARTRKRRAGAKSGGLLRKGRKSIRMRRPRSISIRVRNRRRRRRHNPVVRHRRRRRYNPKRGPKARSPYGKRHRRNRFTIRHPKYVSVRTRNRRRSRRAYRHSRRRNPSYRMRNPGIADVLLPVGLGVAGFVLAAFLLGKDKTGKGLLPDSIGKALTFNIGGVATDFSSAIIPLGLGILAVMFGPKYLPKYSKYVYSIGLGLATFGAVAAAKHFIVPKDNPGRFNFAGYTTVPFRGYTRSLHGYVRKPFGQIERPQLGSGSSKPYGVGLPSETRNYDKFNWGGIYSQSVWE